MFWVLVTECHPRDFQNEKSHPTFKDIPGRLSTAYRGIFTFPWALTKFSPWRLRSQRKLPPSWNSSSYIFQDCQQAIRALTSRFPQLPLGFGAGCCDSSMLDFLSHKSVLFTTRRWLLAYKVDVWTSEPAWACLFLFCYTRFQLLPQHTAGENGHLFFWSSNNPD